MKITVEFSYVLPIPTCHYHLRLTPLPSGGLEMLFDNTTKHSVTLASKLDSDGHPPNLGYLIKHICTNLMRDSRKELFVQNDHVRPGILVLINDADWELEGEDKYELKDGDCVLFVSTLHGG